MRWAAGGWVGYLAPGSVTRLAARGIVMALYAVWFGLGFGSGAVSALWLAARSLRRAGADLRVNGHVTWRGL